MRPPSAGSGAPLPHRGARPQAGSQPAQAGRPASQGLVHPAFQGCQGHTCPSVPLRGGGGPSCPNAPQVPESCRVAPDATQLQLTRGQANLGVQETASMSKSPDAATHKDTGCPRAARHTCCRRVSGPLPALGLRLLLAVLGQAWGGQPASCSLSQRPSQCKWEVLSVRPPATTSTGAGTLTQRLLPGHSVQGQRPNGKQPPGQGWAE